MTVLATKDIDWYSQVSKLETKAIYSATEVDMLNSAVKQSMPRSWLPAIFVAYEEPQSLQSVENKRDFDFSNQSVDGWLSLIREMLYSTASVEDISVSIEDNNVDVWVVIPERDIAVLDQLADIEWELLEIFVSGEHPLFLIDFHIIYRCGRNIDDLVPTRAIRLPRQVG